jgi:stage II sporulation protein E
MLGGSFLAVNPQPLWLALELVVAFLLIRGRDTFERATRQTAPYVALVTIVLVQLFQTVLVGDLGWYALTMVVVEGVLGFVLTLVFTQGIPILLMMRTHAKLQIEEVLCLILMFAAIMSGTLGWTVYGLSIANIISRYLLLVFALVGGGTLGAAVGVVAGLVLTLGDLGQVVQIGLLAFSGLLAGILSRGGKFLSAFGLLIGSSILSIYVATQTDVFMATIEALVGIAFFLITPRALIQQFARYIPSTEADSRKQHDYAKRVRDMTAKKVEQFSEIFQTLSRSFSVRESFSSEDNQQVSEDHYDLNKHDQYWHRQLQESRQLVAEQLQGVAYVMDDLGRELRREAQQMVEQEEQIMRALEGLGLSIDGIDILNLEGGNVEIVVYHRFGRGYDDCRKFIAPLLTDVLGEPIVVTSEQFAMQPGSSSSVVFGSGRAYEIETGVAGLAKNGELFSGDSYTTMELGNGRYALAISDGMGNGERALWESSSALSILQQLLRSGMDERLAIQSVNSILLLRSADEFFATVDVALINMFTAETTFLKVGSSPSFIKRGNEVIPVAADNLPIGILCDIEVDLIKMQLYPGDMLIMMTDGIYDAPGHTVNKEQWIARNICEIDADTPQMMADELMQRVVDYHEGMIMDDMTIIACEIMKFHPQWAPVSLPGSLASAVGQTRTVS